MIKRKEAEQIYKQIPKSLSGKNCRLCGEKLYFDQSAAIMLYDRYFLHSRKVSACLPYCKRCSLHCITPDLLSKIESENPGLRISSFIAVKNENLWRIHQKIATKPTQWDIKWDEPKLTVSEWEYFQRHPEAVLKQFKNYVTAKGIFENDVPSQLMIFAKSIPDEDEMILIISNHDCYVSDGIRIMDYHQKETRKILTQIFRCNKKEIFLYNNKYYISSLLDRNGNQDVQNFRYILDNIMIRHGGGRRESAYSGRRELVDILLYSPYTECYEIVPVTYDKDTLDYFLDAHLYRRFVREYGNPGIDIFTYGFWKGTMKRRDESLLHEFGYNVDKQNGLTDNERQQILADAIDLNLVTKQSTENLLGGFISMHHLQEKYNEACKKWERDLEFVIRYKENPQRFVIKK